MDFKLDRNTILLGLVVLFLVWYTYQASKESFRSKKGVQAGRQSIKRGAVAPVVQAQEVVVVAPPPPPKVVVVAPPPPKVSAPTASGEIDFGDLM